MSEKWVGKAALVTSAPWKAVPDDDGGWTAKEKVGGVLGEMTLVLGEGNPGYETGNVLLWVYRLHKAVEVHKDCVRVFDLLPQREASVRPTQDAAAHVLHLFNGTGYRGGSFTMALVEAFAVADMTNRARLSLVYPEYGEAIRLAKDVWHGMDELTKIARGTER